MIRNPLKNRVDATLVVYCLLHLLTMKAMMPNRWRKNYLLSKDSKVLLLQWLKFVKVMFLTIIVDISQRTFLMA